MDIPVMFPTAEMFTAAAPQVEDLPTFQMIWEEADAEYEHAILANARTRRVARKWEPDRRQNSIICEPERKLTTVSLALGDKGMSKNQRRTRGGLVWWAQADWMADTLEQALALAQLIGRAARRNREFEDANIPIQDRREMYHALFTQKASIPSTLQDYIR